MRSRIVNWIIHRGTLPRWCLFIFDSLIVFGACLLAYIINHGLANTVGHLGPIMNTLVVYQMCFLVGFVLFRSYNVELRRLSFSNLLRCFCALLFGVVLIMLLRRYMGIDRILEEIRFRDLMLMTMIALLCMCGTRVLCKFMFDYIVQFSTRSNVYGYSNHDLLDMELKDLLLRDPISVDFDMIISKLSGRRIMVTGAAGSIGSELARLLAGCGPGELVLIDQAETPLHDLRMIMARKFPHIRCRTIVTDICRRHRMEAIFKRYRPEIIFHAAAYKHVPMMEDNPVESVLNNVIGTKVLADFSVMYGVKKFVMISTDKAVNPTNIMGCSKRICEIYCQSLDSSAVNNGRCEFITTRFGNVLGSNGSVIPIFREQIRHGGPVMVTHPDIVRYFMLIPEACQLVLQAAAIGKGGEIYVFDMGQPVKIVDLAKRMIALSGARDIEIRYMGLRPGEKLYEEVIDEREIDMPTSHPKIKKARVREYDYEDVVNSMNELLDAAQSYNAELTVELMHRFVPEYKSVNIKYSKIL